MFQSSALNNKQQKYPLLFTFEMKGKWNYPKLHSNLPWKLQNKAPATDDALTLEVDVQI